MHWLQYSIITIVFYCSIDASDLDPQLDEAYDLDHQPHEASLSTDVLLEMIVIHRLTSIIPVPIWTKQLPYKEYFYGLSCGVVWYSKEQSERYKNLKIGFFRLTWPLCAVLGSFMTIWKNNNTDGIMRFILLPLIPNISLLNIKYKRLEIYFLDIITIIILLASVISAQGSPMLGALLCLVPAGINIDVS